MIVVCNFFYATGYVLHSLLYLFMWLLIIRALLSWVNPDPSNFIVQFLYSVTEPVLQPIRRRMPRTGMLDLSVLVVIFLIYFLDIAVAGSLLDYGASCKQQALAG